MQTSVRCGNVVPEGRWYSANVTTVQQAKLTSEYKAGKVCP